LVTTVTFRAGKDDIEKLKWLNQVLAKCDKVEDENNSEVIRFLINYNFDLVKNIVKAKAEGHIGSVFNVDFSFLTIDGNKPVV
jgi:hypothetical protein